MGCSINPQRYSTLLLCLYSTILREREFRVCYVPNGFSYKSRVYILLTHSEWWKNIVGNYQCMSAFEHRLFGGFSVKRCLICVINKAFIFIKASPGNIRMKENSTSLRNKPIKHSAVNKTTKWSRNEHSPIAYAFLYVSRMSMNFCKFSIMKSDCFVQDM